MNQKLHEDVYHKIWLKCYYMIYSWFVQPNTKVIQAFEIFDEL